MVKIYNIYTFPSLRLYHKFLTFSHLSHLVRRGPGWVAVLQGTKVYQRMHSDSIVNIFIQEAPYQYVILHCIHPPFLWPPSPYLSLYPHLSHYSNILLPISLVYMSTHAYCYRSYFGLLPCTIICDMVSPVYIVNVSEHPNLSSTYLVFLSYQTSMLVLLSFCRTPP